MATLQDSAVDQRVLLTDVDWETYQAMLNLVGDRPVRITYSAGKLELMSPSRVHEKYKTLLGNMIEFLLREWGMDFEVGGSMTFNRSDLDRGLEPDECYWVASEPAVRGRSEFDANVDPPPDLAVESISRGVHWIDQESIRVWECAKSGSTTAGHCGPWV